MALIAAVAGEDLLAVLSVTRRRSWWAGLRGHHHDHQEHRIPHAGSSVGPTTNDQRPTTNDQRLTTNDYRGCVTTSTSAVSPRSTRATARLSAGPRSFGSVTGPSAYTPML